MLSIANHRKIYVSVTIKEIELGAVDVDPHSWVFSDDVKRVPIINLYEILGY